MPTPNVISKLLAKGKFERSRSGWETGYWVWQHDSGIVYVGWQQIRSDPTPLTREETIDLLRKYQTQILTGPYYADLDAVQLQLEVFDRMTNPDGTTYRGVGVHSPGMATK